MWGYLRKNVSKIADEEIRQEVMRINDQEGILKKRKERIVEKFELRLAEGGAIVDPKSEPEDPDVE